MKRHSRSVSMSITEDKKEKMRETIKLEEETCNGRTRKRNYFIIEYIKEYIENSNLHGLRYIGEKERTIAEKIFWLIVFTVSVGLCAVMIRKALIKWNETPVIVTFSESSTPLWQIPYPAVTVCSETKSIRKRFNYTDYYHLYWDDFIGPNLTEKERNDFEDANMVCDDHLAPPQGRKFADRKQTVNNIKEMAPKLSDIFFGCKWQNDTESDCADLFSSTLTEEGQCYTFNALRADQLFRVENLHQEYLYIEHTTRAENWTLDVGYPAETPLHTYPRRGTGYGAKTGLNFTMNTKIENMDYICRGPVQGFKVLLHNPAELPRLSKQYFRVPLSQEVLVAVLPKMMTTSEGLQIYEPTRVASCGNSSDKTNKTSKGISFHSRQCFFPSERYLQYFRVYTQANCEMECLTNFTYVRCGCVHFGMPHGPNMTVCNSGKMECIKKSQMELSTWNFLSGFDGVSNMNDTLGAARAAASKCQCLQACTSIEYAAETSQAGYDLKAIYKAAKIPLGDKFNDYLFSRVMIHFKEAQFIPTRRSELAGNTDFLASCGGLLGLFMGFSFLSLAELIYFLTLRLFYVLFRKRHNKRAASISSATGPTGDKD